MYIERFVLVIIFFFIGFPLVSQDAPTPVDPTPNERQIDWYNQEIIAFFHFGLNTYEEFVNEGDGRTTTSLFNPTSLDCKQWARTLKAAGIPNGILTAKHADGF